MLNGSHLNNFLVIAATKIANKILKLKIELNLMRALFSLRVSMLSSRVITAILVMAVIQDG